MSDRIIRCPGVGVDDLPRRSQSRRSFLRIGIVGGLVTLGGAAAAVVGEQVGANYAAAAQTQAGETVKVVEADVVIPSRLIERPLLTALSSTPRDAAKTPYLLPTFR